MVSKILLAVLAVSVLLVAGSDAWRRRSFSRAWRAIKKPVVHAGVKLGVKAGLKAVAAKVSAAVAAAAPAAALGKRSPALYPPELTHAQAQSLAEDMINACADLDENLATNGVSFDEFKDILNETDANGDLTLIGEELMEFAAAIQTLEACAEVEKGLKK